MAEVYHQPKECTAPAWGIMLEVQQGGAGRKLRPIPCRPLQGAPMTIEELELAVQTLAGDVTTLVQQFELTTGVNIHSLAVDRDKPTTPAIVRVRTRLKTDH